MKSTGFDNDMDGTPNSKTNSSKATCQSLCGTIRAPGLLTLCGNGAGNGTSWAGWC